MQMLSCISQRSVMTRSQNGITWVWIKPGRLWCGLTSGRLGLIVPKGRDTINLSFIQILHCIISGNCCLNPINSSFDTNNAFALCHLLQIFTEAPSKWLYHRAVYARPEQWWIKKSVSANIHFCLVWLCFPPICAWGCNYSCWLMAAH